MTLASDHMSHKRSERLPALDHLRVLAASAVMLSHGYVLTGSSSRDALDLLSGGQIDIAGLAVDFFFFLSGFLMYGALERNRAPWRFVVHRAARIVPGLLACVVLTVLIGSGLTHLPVIEYWTDAATWRYLRNAFFVFTPSLPGVFEDVPYPGVVNGSLWTLTYEVGCYAVVAALIALPTKRRLVVMYVLMCGCLGWLMTHDMRTPTFVGNVARLLNYFVLGHVFADPRFGEWRAAAVVVVAAVFALVLGTGVFSRVFWHHLAALSCMGVLYGARVLGNRVRGLPFDVSFGIYIYAFPIQQYLADNRLGLSVPLFLVASLMLVLPVAAGSWFWVEKPGMRLIQRLLLTVRA